MLDSIGWQAVPETREAHYLLFAQISIDAPLQIIEEWLQIAQYTPHIQLLLQRLQHLLLSLCAPDITHQVSMSRTHILQRLLPIQMLWPRPNIEPFKRIGTVGVLPRIIRIYIINNRMRRNDIQPTQHID